MTLELRDVSGVSLIFMSHLGQGTHTETPREERERLDQDQFTTTADAVHVSPPRVHSRKEAFGAFQESTTAAELL